MSIDTLIEEEYIYQVLAQSRTGSDAVWIGLTDLDQEGTYRWSNGNSLLRFLCKSIGLRKNTHAFSPAGIVILNNVLRHGIPVGTGIQVII